MQTAIVRNKLAGVVLSHVDVDHYGGLHKLFTDTNNAAIFPSRGTTAAAKTMFRLVYRSFAAVENYLVPFLRPNQAQLVSNGLNPHATGINNKLAPALDTDTAQLEVTLSCTVTVSVSVQPDPARPTEGVPGLAVGAHARPL